MYSLTNSSDLIHITQQICLCLALFGFVVAVHNAHADEVAVPIKKEQSTTNVVRPGSYWTPSYRLGQDISPNPAKGSTASRTRFGSSLQSLARADASRRDDWSINIEKQAPVSEDCANSSTLSCLDTKETPPDATTHHESYWLIFRKAFHF